MTKIFFFILTLMLFSGYNILSGTMTKIPPVINDHGEMILIEAGDFLMGSSEKEMAKISKDAGKSIKYFTCETPQHKVYLDDYYIDRHEVTNRQFQDFIEAGGYENHIYWTEEGWNWKEKNVYEEPKWWLSGQNHSGIKNPTYPVIGVSWYEAFAYASWAGKRLPTEAEWEKAARGTEGNIYPWGMEWIQNNCISMGQEINPAGTLETGKSPYGLYDMSGNVWEWCSDWYNPKYYSTSPSRNPKGPKEGLYKVLKGGCGGNAAYYYFRCAGRHSAKVDYWDAYTGFRCVKQISR
ncbi:MAG: formylglycine-generating enzyme family protein [Candidatus Eremiobacterota bacterium]